jgi:hypothetical protein
MAKLIINYLIFYHFTKDIPTVQASLMQQLPTPYWHLAGEEGVRFTSLGEVFQ